VTAAKLKLLLRWPLPVFVLCTLWSCGDGSADEPTPTAEPPSVVAESEPAEPSEAAWSTANHDLANTRAAVSSITSANVDSLELAWSFELTQFGPAGAAASNPLIEGGVVYFQDLRSRLFAFDLESGEVIWETPREEGAAGPNGPALSGENVFAVRVPGEAFAVDRATGREVWTTPIGPTGSIQPLAHNGVLYVASQPGGEAVYAGGTSGILYALDQEGGDVIWSFQVIEEGFWGNPQLNGGGGSWYPPALDDKSGLLYWGTGNASPFPGTIEFPNGASRPGPNLYANSLLALDSRSGELAWYTQLRQHDLFDLDFQLSPILAEVGAGGTTRRLVIGSGKLGRVIAMDRDNGEVVWDTVVGQHQNDDLTEIPLGQTVTVLPGIFGGVETPMAFADGTVYAVAVNMPTEHSPTGWDATSGPEAASAALQHTDFSAASSELVAIDAASGDVVWTHAFDEANFSGVTVANDLLFTATYSGLIYAFDRETGEELWSYQAPAGINAWPAVAGDYIVWPAGVGRPAALIALRLPADLSD
jgi:glucose dehydrogenase